jgi:hypothetical protein
MSEYSNITPTRFSAMLVFAPAAGGVVDFVENFFCGGFLQEKWRFFCSHVVFIVMKNRRIRNWLHVGVCA